MAHRPDRHSVKRAAVLRLPVLVVLAILLWPEMAWPQNLPQGLPTAPPTPNHFDPRARPTPPTPINRVIRVLTDDDYPPFQFVAPDGALAGFNIELSRAICEDLRVACTIQARRWDTLVDALLEERGDMVVAGHKPTPELRRRVDLSAPYIKTPARFMVRRSAPAFDPHAPRLRIVVTNGSAHQAFAVENFPNAALTAVDSLGTALDALRSDAADAVFADGVALALWLNGPQGASCCAFAGGPWLESRYFGEGMTALFRRQDESLRRSVDGTLQRLTETGKIAELYRRYFPIGIY